MNSAEKRVEFLIIIIQGIAATLPVWPRDLNRQLIAIKQGNIKFKLKVFYMYLYQCLLNLWIVTKSSANLLLRSLFCCIFIYSTRTLAKNCLCLCQLDLKKVLPPKIKPTDPYGGRFLELFMFMTFTLAKKMHLNITSIGKQPILYRFCRGETQTENLLLQGSGKLIQNILQKSTG